jgi:hypothetical protein
MAMLLSLRPRIIRPISMLQLHHGGRMPQRANRASDATRLLRTSPPLEKQQGATIRRPVLPSRTTGRQDDRTGRTGQGQERTGEVRSLQPIFNSNHAPPRWMMGFDPDERVRIEEEEEEDHHGDICPMQPSGP